MTLGTPQSKDNAIPATHGSLASSGLGDDLNFSRVCTEIERAFTELRERLLFKQQTLPLPVITIQSAGRRKAYGWFAKRAWERSADWLPEINLSAEYLNRPVVDVIGTLVHEMVHLSNFLARERDCSSTNYHNRRFKELAERVGLICERADDGKNLAGWAYTAVSPMLAEKILDLRLDESVFATHRQLQAELIKPGAARQAHEATEPKLKKWSCGRTNVWSAIEVRAMCLKPACGGAFRRSQVFQ
jgi:hypothetical protein